VLTEIELKEYFEKLAENRGFTIKGSDRVFYSEDGESFELLLYDRELNKILAKQSDFGLYVHFVKEIKE